MSVTPMGAQGRSRNMIQRDDNEETLGAKTRKQSGDASAHPRPALAGAAHGDRAHKLLAAYYLLLNFLTAQGRPLTDEERDALQAILDTHHLLQRQALKRKVREQRRKARRLAAGGEWAVADKSGV